MSHFDPHERPKPAVTTPAPRSATTLTTVSGVRIVVHDHPAPEPEREEPEPPRETPDVIIVPEGQLARDRDAFIAGLDAKWGGFIEKELARRKDVAKASRPDVHQAVLVIISNQYEKERKAGGSGAPDKVPAYLQKVIDNAVMNHATKKARRLQPELGVELDQAPDAALDPEREAARAELWEKLDRYGADLTPEEREVFEARERDGMTLEMIATVLQRPLSTVFNQHARAMRKLRDRALASERGTTLARGSTARPAAGGPAPVRWKPGTGR